MPVFIQKIVDFFAHIPWLWFLSGDTGLVISLFVLSLFYAVILGRQRVFLILISIYVALGVLAYMPVIGRVSEAVLSPSKQIYFAAGFFILFFLLARGVLGQIFHQGRQVSGWWTTLFLAFLQLCLITSIAFSFLPKNYLDHFSPFIKMIFLNEWARFGWLFLPIFLMAALAKKGDNE